MTKYRTIPYTSSDLRGIADKIDEIISVLEPEDGFLEDGDWRWGVGVAVQDPESDTIVGEIRPHGDGWLAFYPKEATG